MKNEEIVKALREHAEWAQANEWETPITLSDDLAAAADLIEKLTDRCARYAEEIAVARERTRLIPVTERLPEDHMKKCIVFAPILTGTSLIWGDILALTDGCLKDGISHNPLSLTGCRCRSRRRRWSDETIDAND